MKFYAKKLMDKTVLFIGRFQPFHNGHLNAIRQIFEDKKIKNLIIMIGSAENDFLPDNPFTAGERFTMIETALKEAKINKEKYSIIPVRDINRYSLWTKHVRKLLPNFDVVYSGSKLIRHLFEQEKEIEVREIHLKLKISATKIREMIKNGKDYSKLVPSSIKKILEKLNAKKRLIEIDKK